MSTIEEIYERTYKFSIYLSEMVKGTSYEQDLANIDSFTNEELIIKTEALILKTKMMIKNTKPDSDWEVINKLFSDEEEVLETIKNKPYISKEKHTFFVQKFYKYVLGTHLLHKNFCDRIVNKNNEMLLKALQENGKYIRKAENTV